MIGTTAITGAVVKGGGEILDQRDRGEQINWGAVLAHTAGGAGEGALFGVPGIGTGKLMAGAAAIGTAENYLSSGAYGDWSLGALGNAAKNGAIECIPIGAIDIAAKRILSPLFRDKLKRLSKSQQIFDQSISKSEVETVMKDAKGLFHGENGQYVSLKKAQEASEAGKLIDKSGKVIKLEDKIELTFENSAANAISIPDSATLGKNMEAAGIKRPSYPHAAHHIVAGNAEKAAKAREILQKFEIDINAAENGVYLPNEKGVSKAAYHPSLHTTEYYKKVNEILSHADSKEDVLDFLSSISQKLLNGTF